MDDTLRNDNLRAIDDNVQHGIDDDPNNDAEKGAALGGVGGAVVGGIAGAAAGPVGAVVGAVAGAAAGAVGSGAAVAAVDSVDNDNNVTGIGDDVHTEDNPTVANTDDTNYGLTGTTTQSTGIGRDV